MAKNDKVEDLKQVLNVEDKVKSFQGLLDSIESLEDKKKALWKEIYENAVTDRVNAYQLFVELHNIVKNDNAQHAIQGPQLAKYLERMSRSTDQLIKLAELIAEAERAGEALNPDEIYSHSRMLK